MQKEIKKQQNKKRNVGINITTLFMFVQINSSILQKEIKIHRLNLRPMHVFERWNTCNKALDLSVNGTNDITSTLFKTCIP